jgi:hypothetical protein
MDMTGYGYRKPGVQRESAADSTAQVNGERSPELNGAALRLLVTLDVRIPLTALPAHFPRVLNRVAEVWNRPTEADYVFDELLLDGRGGRQGFPSVVIEELTRLRAYHHVLYPQKVDPWDENLLR